MSKSKEQDKGKEKEKEIGGDLRCISKPRKK